METIFELRNYRYTWTWDRLEVGDTYRVAHSMSDVLIWMKIPEGSVCLMTGVVAEIDEVKATELIKVRPVGGSVTFIDE